MELGSRSCDLIFLSEMAAYSSSMRRPELGMSGIPDVSFSFSVLKHNTPMISLTYRHKLKLLPSARPKIITEQRSLACCRSLMARQCLPDVDDDCVAVVAHGIQRPCRADIACIPPEAAEYGLQDARSLRMHAEALFPEAKQLLPLHTWLHLGTAT